MKVFLDANILVSVLNKGYPLFTYSSRILSLADTNRFNLYTSPICLAIAFYFSEKKSGARVAKSKIDILVLNIKIASTDSNSVISITKNKAILDFEYGLEYYSAIYAKCDCIVTEDVDDFHFSDIPVYDSRQFIEQQVAG